MRYRLRTLMIALALAPPLLAAFCLYSREMFTVAPFSLYAAWYYYTWRNPPPQI